MTIKLDYKFLTHQKNAKWFYSVDKKTANGFFCWFKVEDTIEKDKYAKSNEYYIEFKCLEKTMSDEIVKINPRSGEKPIMERKKMPFQPIHEKHIAMAVLKNIVTKLVMLK